ncbi:MAG TPA: trypsin-like peptidase domain-containing protein [Saprospiraceae bacterium]|nr:trypsin-like peptidase domain-containing protein [Saprospiraceae bacterium]HPI08179.1 trypsin-like peptidase domain-containing protein [Saprospiraceae bacterium]
MNKFWSTVLAGATGGLLTFGAAKLTEKPQLVTNPETPSYARQASYGGAPVPFDFTKAAERSMDAVVHIKASESKESAIQRQRDQRYSDPLQFFFGQRFQYEPQPRSGTGSGVIYTEDGYILTNNHVVDFADEFEVTLHDNREFKARLVGRDESTDMAVIKIDATGLAAIEIGNSDDVRVGEWVLAVGNPFDLTSTVTAGIVSAKARDIDIIKGASGIESFIQTDAAVNPGNSGGALVDVEGRLIGINSAIATPTGVFAGYSFAIPVNLVKRIADDLMKYGSYKRAYLGVNIATMDSYVARELALDYTQGVAVVEIADTQGSAAQAGIQAKDIITKVNGKNVTTTAELMEYIGRSRVGETLSVSVIRDGKSQVIPVRLKTKSDG